MTGVLTPHPPHSPPPHTHTDTDTYTHPAPAAPPPACSWLREAVSYDPAALATDLSWQCPLLIQFLVRGEAGAGGGERVAAHQGV